MGAFAAAVACAGALLIAIPPTGEGPIARVAARARRHGRPPVRVAPLRSSRRGRWGRANALDAFVLAKRPSPAAAIP
jgi:hypothetical protein